MVAFLRERGIDVRLDANLVTLEGDPIHHARLDDGQRIPCDLFVFAIGTTPNNELARAAGLNCGRGVVVDAHLRTSDPSICAIGKVAEFSGDTFGTTAAAEEQATALAEYLRGNLHAPYNGTVLAYILKLPGLEVAACGVVNEERNPELETIVFEDVRRRVYQKCVIQGERLVGAVMVGRTAGFERLRELIANGTELEELRGELLIGGQSAAPRGRLVCSCNQIGEETITSCIAGGAKDLQVVCSATSAGTSVAAAARKFVR